jgi:uncharacterized protein YjdB
MNTLRKNQVLVLALFGSFSTTLWTSGCAGFAEPLPSLAITPNVLSVSAKVGTASSEAVSVMNVGTKAVSVSRAIVTGNGFSVSGLTTPVTLQPNQTQSFMVKFAAASAGNVNGSLTIMTDVRHRPVVLSLHGDAVTTSPSVESVAITPVTASAAPGGKVQFTATIHGTTTNDSVNWTTSTGTITAAGLYTAPAGATVSTVTATSLADPTKSASAVVTIASASNPGSNPPPRGPAVIGVTISPATTSTSTGGTISFTATVLGTTLDKSVTWNASLGSITSAGVYTAPATAGTSIVTATSVADPTKVGTATVTVGTPATQSVTSVGVSPATTSVKTDGTISFSATVAGSASNRAVTWNASSGSITTAGVYTAPATAGTSIVTATSVADPTKVGTATVKVTSAPATQKVTSVSVSPATASVKTGRTISFSATVEGDASNKAVTWHTSSGSITDAGVYTAPATAGTSIVTATSVFDATEVGTATITVIANNPLPTVTSVSVSPATASMKTGGTISFSATVAGSASNKAVTWHASSGSITSAGVYTAPATAGTSIVTATSVFDATEVGTATVTVTPVQVTPTVTSVTVSPATAASTTGGTLPFTATVQGTTTNKAVTWTAALGSITASGAYTAPAKAGTDTVTATSVADTTKSDSATVTVTAPRPTVTSVTVSPTSASATTNGTLQFRATVNGTDSDKSVNWKATLGDITSSGQYTAPSSAGTDTVTATSDADSTKSASAQVSVTAPVTHNGALPAFPGAEGGGAVSVGGRGGQVIYVTNLQDSGSGSLRACVQASGARTCVFTVGGVIHPADDIKATSPYLTIAGQTAPGGGITLQGDQYTTADALLWISTHDVVVRYITVAPGYASNVPGPDSGSTGILLDANAHNVITDHTSIRWSSDKPYLVNNNGNGSCGGSTPNAPFNTTFQWSMLYEPNAGHAVGPGVGATSGDAQCETDNDFHHNLFATISHRIPTYYGATGRWQDNITWNWSEGSGGSGFGFVGEGGSNVDVINNKLVAGNLNSGGSCNIYEFDIDNDNNSGDFDNQPLTLPYVGNQYYFSGNMGPHESNPGGDQMLMVGLGTDIEGGGCPSGRPPSSAIRTTPLSTQAFPITADSAESLNAVILHTVGNSQGLSCDGTWVNRQDAPDARIISLYESNGADDLYPETNSPPSAPYNQPTIAAGTACTESLHDGIPDAWKALKGLSTSDPSLYRASAPNGYTWLENYLNAQ